MELLAKSHFNPNIPDALENDKLVREEKWSRSIAVGDEQYVDCFKEKLAVKGISRRIGVEEEGCSLNESPEKYEACRNSFRWDV